MALDKTYLSGGTADGRGIKVVATATPGTLVHTVPAASDDTIRLYAYNDDSVVRTLTVEFGGVTVPDDIFEVTVQPKSGLQLVVPALRLATGLVVRAFADAANVVVLRGDVNRES